MCPLIAGNGQSERRVSPADAAELLVCAEACHSEKVHGGKSDISVLYELSPIYINHAEGCVFLTFLGNANRKTGRSSEFYH